MSQFQEELIQGSLFEEEYLVRTLGRIVSYPQVALTELVANAWDAGASEVNITIPNDYGQLLVVEDDGCGMKPDQFRHRWMTLGYDRTKHQGRKAEFPTERKDWKRPAYGKRGIGRHGLLCFGPRYSVETKRDGQGSRFVVATLSGRDPFGLIEEDIFSIEGHGTKLSVEVTRNLPHEKRITDVLSARFLHDPQFVLYVNERSVPLAEHVGLIDSSNLRVNENVSVDAFFIDSTQAARTTWRQGVAFWVGGRLVGQPSWTIGRQILIDGRTHLAKRYTAVIKSNDLFDEVLPDWSGFEDVEVIEELYTVVAEYVEQQFRIVSKARIKETQVHVLSEHRKDLRELRPLAKLEVSEFVRDLAVREPIMQREVMSVAVKAIINLEKSRSGVSLLRKLAELSEEDIEGLDRLLSEWTIRDALTVLDEIDQRIAVSEAISKLCSDRKIDELRTLHPLITQARWLFGPEFDSPEYSSNQSLRKAVEKVFKQRIDKDVFINYRNRPDLVILADSTLSAVATEDFDSTRNLTQMRRVLLIEVKRGGSRVGRNEMNQAANYVEDLLGSGSLDGPPFIQAFVIGHEMDNRIQRVRTLGENPISGRINGATYLQLVRTTEKRLFRLQNRLAKRYEKLSGVDLLKQVLEVPDQLSLDISPKNETSEINE